MIANKNAKSKRGRGRPKTYFTKTTVYLNVKQKVAIQTLGCGCLTAGIRRLIDEHVKKGNPQ